MIRNEYEVGHSDVLDSVHKHRIFGWSWCQYQEEPFRHTAILLYFDYKPKYTVNFRPDDNGSKLGAFFDCTASKVVAEKIIPGTAVEFHPPFEEITIYTHDDKSTVLERLQFFLTAFSDASYNLVIQNCRSHVKHVVYKAREKWNIAINPKFKQFADSQDEPHDFDKHMNKVKSDDDLRYAGAGISAVVGVAVVAGAAKLFYDWAVGGNENEEEDEEKQVSTRQKNRERYSYQ